MVMGIVNVTPDSFYPASRTADAGEAIARGRALFDLGCDVVDVGGESTRPGATPVAADDEASRVVPVVEALARVGTVSIDTLKESVARSAIKAGATILNDVSGRLVELAGELGVGYVAMHRRGDPTQMQDNPTYDDVVGEVEEYLRGLSAGRARGARPPAAHVRRLWIDPGIGFGKTVEHNLALLAHVGRFVELAEEFDAGVLIGTSRKRFLEHLGAARLEVDQRLEGSVASEAWVLLQGVSMVRVHDAAAAVQLRELLIRRVEEVVA
jgi:dihydropteroate synthase